MISWGTKYDSIGTYEDAMEESCSICSNKDRPIFKVEQGYFTLYGMALFPTSKKYFKICTSCDTRLKVRASDPNLPSIQRAVPGRLKLKYIWGWLILLPIISGIIYLFNMVSSS